MNKQIALGEFATTVKPVVSQGFGYLGGDQQLISRVQLPSLWTSHCFGGYPPHCWWAAEVDLSQS